METGALSATLSGHKARVRGLALVVPELGTDPLLASVSTDGSVCLWSVKTVCDDSEPRYRGQCNARVVCVCGISPTEVRPPPEASCAPMRSKRKQKHKKLRRKGAKTVDGERKLNAKINRRAGIESKNVGALSKPDRASKRANKRETK